jgi:hypothetical protein
LVRRHVGDGSRKISTDEVAMNLADFQANLAGAAPAPGLDAPLAALWWAAKGKWDEAHHLVQDESTASAAWVHAYLHRVEGDLGNAGYWYRRAGQPVATDALVYADTISPTVIPRVAA